MQRMPTLTFHNLKSSPALEKRIREKIEKMSQRFSKIVSCHVVVECSHQSQAKGRMYQVHIDVIVPGKELVVSHHPGKNPFKHDKVYAAMNDAFDAIERQLERHFDQSFHFVKSHEPHWREGTVVEIFPVSDYGFLRDKEGETVYFHRHAVYHNKFDELNKDSAVRYVLANDPGDKGPHATAVKILQRAA